MDYLASQTSKILTQPYANNALTDISQYHSKSVGGSRKKRISAAKKRKIRKAQKTYKKFKKCVRRSYRKMYKKRS